MRVAWITASLAGTLIAAPTTAQTTVSSGQDAGAQAGATAVEPPPAPSTAPAAQAAADRVESGSDIVVTARRREESISKVPIAITALTGETLAKQSIRSEADLQAAVPGLVVRESGGSNNFNYAIRGQSIDPYTSSPPAVLAYINEFQVFSYSASSFFDLDGVQVLKGPQGTLFGRNTTGGAVLYQTAVPGSEQTGFFTLRGGNLGSRQATFAGTMPITDGLSLRIAGNYSDGGAYVLNLNNGDRVGNNLNKTVRGTLRFDRGGVANTLVAQYGTDRGTNAPNILYSVNSCGERGPTGIPLNSASACLLSPGVPAFNAIVAANPGLFAGGLDNFLALQKARGPFVANVNSSLKHLSDTYFFINTTSIDVGAGLTLKNIAGYSKSSKNDRYDFDGTPYGIYENAEVTALGQAQSTRQFSNELQLQGRILDDRLTFVVGAFYSDQRDTLVSNGKFFDLAPVIPQTFVPYNFVNTVKSIAGFAQGTFSVTDTVNLTGGFRYSRDKVTGRNVPPSVFGSTFQQIKNQKPSWTVSVDWQATPDLLFYATHRGSWRAGGINFTGVPINETAALGGNLFLPETTQDIEVGTKFSGRIGGVPVTFSADGYYQWVQDVQRSSNLILNGNPALVTINVPEAQVRGFEGSLTVRPAAWLSLGVSGSYTDAEFTDPNTLAVGIPATYGPFADVPKLAGAAFAEVSRALEGDAGTIRLRGDVYAQKGVFFSNLANTVTPGTKLPGYALVNLRLGWEKLLGSSVDGSFYVRNLLDKEYYTGGIPTGPAFGVDTASPGRPRTYGAEVRFNF